MKKMFIVAILSIWSAANVGCISKAIEAAIPQKGKVAEEVRKVKSVAIVGFDVLTYEPAGLAAKVAPAASMASQGANRARVESELAKSLYGGLRKELENQGWRVLSLEKVVGSPLYASLYKAKGSKLADQQIGPSQKPNVIRSLLRASNPTYLFKEDEIQNLTAALGVDAIVIARVSYNSDANDSLGFGLSSRHLAATFAYTMYDRHLKSPIWFDFGFRGPESEEAIGRIYGMEDKALIDRIAQPVGENAMRDFFKK